jgi:hypothetical protein
MLDLDARGGAVLVRHGKGGRRREVGVDPWGWDHLRPWQKDPLAGTGPPGGSAFTWTWPARLASLLIRVGNRSPERGGDMIVTIAQGRRLRSVHEDLLDQGRREQKEHGCKRSETFGDRDDPRRLCVAFDWEIEDYESSSPIPRSRRSPGTRSPRTARAR